jgi:hypothetical protein
VIAVNTTYQMAPWADALFAMDAAWWKIYYKEVSAVFRGAMYSVNNFTVNHYPRVVQVAKPFTSFGNSGAGAVHMAVKGGAKRIILLGYDCQHTGGERHWHGNHPKGLGNADVINRWPQQFARLRDSIPAGVEVINCTRTTALESFPRRELWDALEYQ